MPKNHITDSILPMEPEMESSLLLTKGAGQTPFWKRTLFETQSNWGSEYSPSQDTNSSKDNHKLCLLRTKWPPSGCPNNICLLQVFLWVSDEPLFWNSSLLTVTVLKFPYTPTDEFKGYMPLTNPEMPRLNPALWFFRLKIPFLKGSGCSPPKLLFQNVRLRS